MADSSHIAGLGSLTNFQWVNPEMDLTDVEQRIMNRDKGIPVKKVQKISADDPVEEFDKEMSKIEGSTEGDEEDNQEDNQEEQEDDKEEEQDDKEEEQDDKEEEQEDDDDEMVKPREYIEPVPVKRTKPKENITEEQVKRSHVSAVMDSLRNNSIQTSHSVRNERIQDLKASKLEQIMQLSTILNEEGISCKDIKIPTQDSSMEEIDSVLGFLRLKNDRNRYASLAEELVVSIAEGVESTLDGETEIPLVGWKPDYTGYGQVVQSKLRRMRFETSQIVGEVLESLHVGPIARVFIELLPSFFLYPRLQAKQKESASIESSHGSGQSGGAISSIRDMDEMRSI